MEVESPYYLPNNRSGNNQNSRQYGTGNNRLQPQPPTNMSNSQNMSNNYSNISMNSNNSVNLNPYNQGRGNHNYQPLPPQYQQQPQQNYNQPYNQQYSQPQKNNFFNQQHPQQGYQNYQQPPPKVEYEMPENWEDMAGAVMGNNDPEFKEQVLTQMNEHLFTEE